MSAGSSARSPPRAVGTGNRQRMGSGEGTGPLLTQDVTCVYHNRNERWRNPKPGLGVGSGQIGSVPRATNWCHAFVTSRLGRDGCDPPPDLSGGATPPPAGWAPCLSSGRWRGRAFRWHLSPRTGGETGLFVESLTAVAGYRGTWFAGQRADITAFPSCRMAWLSFGCRQEDRVRNAYRSWRTPLTNVT